jgi:hypothetical protein
MTHVARGLPRLTVLSPVAGLAALVLVAGPSPIHAQTYPEELFSNLEWENIGPSRGGRSTAVAGSAARPLEYYFGATGGGLWKTTDAGNTWENVTDHQINSASVGAVQVCEADPDVVYIGTGETQLRGNIQQGDGVYRTTDGGETWTHLGLEEAQNFARIRVHPSDCNTAPPGRADRRRGPLPGRIESGRALRGPVGGVAEVVGHELRRPRIRSLQVRRRR